MNCHSPGLVVLVTSQVRTTTEPCLTDAGGISQFWARPCSCVQTPSPPERAGRGATPVYTTHTAPLGSAPRESAAHPSPWASEWPHLRLLRCCRRWGGGSAPPPVSTAQVPGRWEWVATTVKFLYTFPSPALGWISMSSDTETKVASCPLLKNPSVDSAQALLRQCNCFRNCISRIIVEAHIGL